jgi:hypothetical protein
MNQSEDFNDRKNDRKSKFTKKKKVNKKDIFDDDMLSDHQSKKNIKRVKENLENEEWEDWDQYYNR